MLTCLLCHYVCVDFFEARFHLSVHHRIYSAEWVRELLSEEVKG
jgi:hypothetical protein